MINFRINREDKSAPRPEQKVNKTLKKNVFHHQKVIKHLLDVIATCPMDDELKMILRMRIWGRNPLVFAPMTYLQISQDLKCKVKDVQRWEEDALYNVKIYLKKTGVEAAAEKFKTDNGMKKLIDPQKRIIV